MSGNVLSGRALDNLKKFLAEPASVYAAEGPKNPYSKIRDWASDPEYGGLPRQSARFFANWILDAWDDFLDGDDTSVTVQTVLEGAVTDWCGGRVMPS